MSTDPAQPTPQPSPARLQERALQLALKDRPVDVAAEGITIADTQLTDRPLIYANEGFERVTGYAVRGGGQELPVPAEPRQRSGRGPRDPRRSRRAARVLVEILIYRRDGTMSLPPLDNAGFSPMPADHRHAWVRCPALSRARDIVAELPAGPVRRQVRHVVEPQQQWPVTLPIELGGQPLAAEIPAPRSRAPR